MQVVQLRESQEDGSECLASPPDIPLPEGTEQINSPSPGRVESGVWSERVEGEDEEQGQEALAEELKPAAGPSPGTPDAKNRRVTDVSSPGSVPRPSAYAIGALSTPPQRTANKENVVFAPSPRSEPMGIGSPQLCTASKRLTTPGMEGEAGQTPGKDDDAASIDLPVEGISNGLSIPGVEGRGTASNPFSNPLYSEGETQSRPGSKQEGRVDITRGISLVKGNEAEGREGTDADASTNPFAHEEDPPAGSDGKGGVEQDVQSFAEDSRVQEFVQKRMKEATNPCHLAIRDFADPQPVFGFVTPDRTRMVVEIPRMQLSGGDAYVYDADTRSMVFRIAAKAFVSGLRRVLYDADNNPILSMGKVKGVPAPPPLITMANVHIGGDAGSHIATIEGKAFDTVSSIFLARIHGREQTYSAQVHLGRKTYFTVLFPGDMTCASMQVTLQPPSSFKPVTYHVEVAAGFDQALAVALVSEFHAHVGLRKSSLPVILQTR